MGKQAKLVLLATIVFTLLCFVLLVALGIKIVHPYQYTRSFKKIQCHGVESEDHGFLECPCNHRVNCWSVFPCHEVTVEYTPPADTKRRSVIFSNYETLYDDKPCSHVPCEASPKSNEISVKWFVKTYGSPAPFDCFVNPKAPHEVILRLPDELPVIMSMVWSSLGFLVGVIVLILIYHRAKVFSIGGD